MEFALSVWFCLDITSNIESYNYDVTYIKIHHVFCASCSLSDLRQPSLAWLSHEQAISYHVFHIISGRLFLFFFYEIRFLGILQHVAADVFLRLLAIIKYVTSIIYIIHNSNILDNRFDNTKKSLSKIEVTFSRQKYRHINNF